MSEFLIENGLDGKEGKMRGFATAIVLTFLAARIGICVEEKNRPAMVVVTDYPDIYTAVEAARTLGIGRIYIPAGVYNLDRTLDLTGLSWSPIRPETSGEEVIPRFNPIIVEGAGSRTMLIARTGDTPAIDLTGSQPGMVLRDFVLQTPWDEKNGWQPGSKVGIFMSRMSQEGGKPGDPPTGNAASSGSHIFHNVTVRGNYPTAAVFSWNSESNSFYHCHFSNSGGDGFVFTGHNPMNREGVRSPYRRPGISSNVHAVFYYCGFSSGGKDSAGLRVSQAGDVYIIGGYFSSGGEAFASIYLDGTSRVQNFIIRDVRMETSAGYNLYAVGAVSDVLIEGGEWVCMNAENIRQEHKIPAAEGPHKYVSNPEGAGYAYNWIVRELRLSRSFEDDPNLGLDKSKTPARGNVTMKFDGLQDSHIDNIAYYVRRQVPGEQAWTGSVVTDTPLIVVEKYSRRNTFEVPSRAAVELHGDARSNSIIALADGLDEAVPALWMSGRSEKVSLQKYYDAGIRRTYVNPDSSGSLLNLGLQNVFDIKNPETGDIALHDGSGFKDNSPRLAVYNGKKWIFFTQQAEIQ